MKKFYIYCASIMLVLTGTGLIQAQQQQQRLTPEERKTFKMQLPLHSEKGYNDQPVNLLNTVNETVAASPLNNAMSEIVIGLSTYDLQTNSSMPSRIVAFPDNKLSAIWTFSSTSTTWPDRGMAYNHYDGSSWINNPGYAENPLNISRVEGDVRTGFGAIDFLNGVGDYILAHQTEIDALQTTRNTGLGTQDWITTAREDMPLLWPKMRIGGPDGKSVHVIGLTIPGGTFGGTPFNGIDGAMLYNRSLDGGNTFDKLMFVLPEVDSTIFASFSGDGYNIDVSENTIAIVAGTTTSRVQMWKSTDNGETWTTRVVMPFAFEPFTGQGIDANGDGEITDTDTVNVSDGSFSILIDNNDNVHVWYGNMFMGSDGLGEGFSYFPYTCGIRYWNETFEQDQLPILIATCDENGDGVEDVEARFGTANVVNYNGQAQTSYPSSGIGADGTIYLVYAGSKEGEAYLYNPTGNIATAGPSLKHLYLMRSSDGGQSWVGPYDLVEDENTLGFDQTAEYAFPAIARNVDDFIHILFQKDGVPGSAVTIDNATIHPQTENQMVYLKVPKDYEPVSTKEVARDDRNLTIFPNPTENLATLQFTLAKAETVSVKVVNMIGQTVFDSSTQKAAAGVHSIELSTNMLSSGVYFVNVEIGNDQFTRKLIVK